MIATPAHPGTAKEFTDTVSVAGEDVGREKITEILNHSPPRQKVFFTKTNFHFILRFNGRKNLKYPKYGSCHIMAAVLGAFQNFNGVFV